MKQELIQLLQEYKDHCDSESKKLSEQQGIVVYKSVELCGFLEWLTSKE